MAGFLDCMVRMKDDRHLANRQHSVVTADHATHLPAPRTSRPTNFGRCRIFRLSTDPPAAKALHLEQRSCSRAWVAGSQLSLPPKKGGVPMIARCANPECSRTFRYLHEGRLFAFDIAERPGSQASMPHSEFSCQKQRTQFFWLCSDCCLRNTLSFTPVEGRVRVSLQPIVRRMEKFYEAA